MTIAAKLRHEVKPFTRMGYIYARRAVKPSPRDSESAQPPAKEPSYADGTKRIPKRAAPSTDSSTAGKSSKRRKPEAGTHCERCNRDGHDSADCLNANPDCNDVASHAVFKNSPKGRAWQELGITLVPFNIDLKGDAMPGRTPGPKEAELAKRI